MESQERHRLAARIIGKAGLLVFAALVIYPLTIRAFRSLYGEVYVERARGFINTQLYYETEGAALKALQQNPQDGYARYYLGAFYRKQGRLEDAARELGASLRTIQHPATALRMLGEIAFVEKRYKDALQYYSRAMKIDPEPVLEPQANWFLLGRAAYETREFATAAVALHEAERLGAKEADLARLEARSYASLGVYSRALFIYGILLAAKPDDASVSLEMAEIYVLAGDRDKSAGILQKLDAAGTLPLGGYQLLGALFAEKNDLKSAASVLERGKERYPESPRVYFLLGEIYARMGNDALMRENYERHLRLLPQSPQRTRIEQRLKAKP